MYRERNVAKDTNNPKLNCSTFDVELLEELVEMQ
jgi:hypothetical protein